MSPWLNFAGPIIIAAVGAIFGGRYAAKRSSQVDNRRIDLEGYKDLNDALQREIARREKEEERHDEQVRRLREEHARLESRLDHLVRDREDDERRHRRETQQLLSRLDALIEWSRRVVRIARDQGVTIPPPPPGVEDTPPQGDAPITR